MIAKNAPERPVHRTSPVLACRSNRFCRLAGANPNTAGQLIRLGASLPQECQRFPYVPFERDQEAHGDRHPKCWGHSPSAPVGLKWPEFDLKFCLVVSLILGDFLGASVAQDGKFP